MRNAPRGATIGICSTGVVILVFVRYSKLKMISKPDLTGREIEILQQVATGASNRQIAQQLEISANTVKVHLSNIFQKLGVASRTEATLYAMQAGLVEGVESTRVTPPRPWWQRSWVIAGGALVIALVAIVAGALLNPGEPPPENVVDLEQLERERWQELAPMPTARKGFAVAAYDGKIYAIAGETEEGVTDVVERYDPVEDSWETLPSKPTAVTDVQAVVIGGKIYVPGGEQADGKPTNLLEIFDPLTERWETASPIPQAISRYGLAAYEGRLYVLGGSDGTAPQASVWIYSLESEDWIAGDPMPAAVMNTGVVAVSGGILVLGGSDAGEYLDRVQLYQPERDGTSATAWSLRASQPYTGADLTAIGFGDTVYLFGAEDGEAYPLMQKYNFGEDTWQSLALPFETRWLAPGVTQSGNEVFFLGGHIDGEATSRLMSYTAIYSVLLPIIQ